MLVTLPPKRAHGITKAPSTSASDAGSEATDDESSECEEDANDKTRKGGGGSDEKEKGKEKEKNVDAPSKDSRTSKRLSAPAQSERGRAITKITSTTKAPRSRRQYYTRKPTVVRVKVGDEEVEREEDESVAMVDPIAAAIAASIESAEGAEDDSSSPSDLPDKIKAPSGMNVAKKILGENDRAPPSSFFSPRDLFTVHVSEDEKRTIVFRPDTKLINVLERICFARAWPLQQVIVRDPSSSVSIVGILFLWFSLFYYYHYFR